MGKKQKEHRKRVKARNARISQDIRQIEVAVKKFIDETNRAVQRPETVALGPGPKSYSI
jgi:hypothetical protein